ncbi:hypothetical protein [Alkalihalobacillus sp. AL-G]|uniref:hypothetical protein n=1 Tax=Alkalihalobacillus sp. AL-G TaxID=2926399 RepID=UPI00272AABD2|nr:hypothetical protein [Alkalihalobacillus sp. AL-G]WLD91582.1 hypothetical protein MOJ78_11040 [Alkalihalobacillus sp. AL-G]
MEDKAKKKSLNEPENHEQSVNPWDAMWGLRSDEEPDIEEVEEKGDTEEEQDDRRDPWLW